MKDHGRLSRRRQVRLLDLSQELTTDRGALFARLCLKARNACAVSRESRMARGVRPVGQGVKTDPSHG